MRIDTIVGVDFSGAKLAGKNIWLAYASIDDGMMRLNRLARLEDLAGSAERDFALRFLTQQIAESQHTLWGIDFPFGLPIELWKAGFSWTEQLEHIAASKLDAPSFGRWCVQIALQQGDRLHIRRSTDTESKTPFDCYHYRIIYQTFHGMRDVLRPLMAQPGTAIPPFSRVQKKTRRIVVEACPSSTLKRLALPHQNYKQPAGGPLLLKRRRTRHVILDGLSRFIQIGDRQRRIIQRNPGGDALDAVIAAVGTAQAWDVADHRAIATHTRYSREGLVFY